MLEALKEILSSVWLKEKEKKCPSGIYSHTLKNALLPFILSVKLLNTLRMVEVPKQSFEECI